MHKYMVTTSMIWKLIKFHTQSSLQNNRIITQFFKLISPLVTMNLVILMTVRYPCNMIFSHHTYSILLFHSWYYIFSIHLCCFVDRCISRYAFICQVYVYIVCTATSKIVPISNRFVSLLFFKLIGIDLIHFSSLYFYTCILLYFNM